jgi:hypothetical protein
LVLLVFILPSILSGFNLALHRLFGEDLGWAVDSRACLTAADLEGVVLHGLGLGLGHSDLLSILKALSSIDAGWLATGVAAASCAGCSSDGIGGGGLVCRHRSVCLRYENACDAMLMKEN